MTLAVLALVACGHSSPSPPPPSPARHEAVAAALPDDIVTPDAEPLDPIHPVLGIPGYPKDCTLPAVFAEMTTSLSPIDCGLLGPRETPEVRQRALDCVIAAVSEDKPFVLVENHQGIDSRVARGLIARRETGAGVVAYAASYDSDPCGGGCFEKGGAVIARCAPSVAHRSAADCPRTLLECVTCSGSPQTTACTQGP